MLQFFPPQPCDMRESERVLASEEEDEAENVPKHRRIMLWNTYIIMFFCVSGGNGFLYSTLQWPSTHPNAITTTKSKYRMELGHILDFHWMHTYFFSSYTFLFIPHHDLLCIWCWVSVIPND